MPLSDDDAREHEGDADRLHDRERFAAQQHPEEHPGDGVEQADDPDGPRGQVLEPQPAEPDDDYIDLEEPSPSQWFG